MTPPHIGCRVRAELVALDSARVDLDAAEEARETNAVGAALLVT
tara:strand:+ start:411 stop:542 length:132 start_codon:yes stop_codon:yes gene_type:complete